MGKKVLMAMSGGIDSTVAALLLREQGYELAGATFLTFPPHSEDLAANPDGNGGTDAVREARQVADTLGIEHHVLDFSKAFRDSVVANFICEYMAGRTPNPCVVCNSSIKWGMLLRKADELGCDCIATGHYARIVQQNGHHYLAAAADVRKDQTYFLWKLTEQELARTIFPLGAYTKQQVRQIAADHGFVQLSKKAESQEICFIPDNDYRRFLSENVPDFETHSRPGNFIDADGKKIGRHEGYPFYTIGQRKGLRVAFGTPKYVTKISAEHNTVTLGDRDELLADSLRAVRCRFTDVENLRQHPDVQARIRYKSPATAANVTLTEDGCTLKFGEPVWGVTPGQSVVLYRNGLVVGGGIIAE